MKLSRQLFRYGLVGVSVNLSMYALYLILVTVGIPYIFSMSIVYCLGLCLAFVMNKNWTFRQNVNVGQTSAYRFIVCYGIGYVVNLVLLWFLVTKMHVRQEFAQAGLICVIAIGLFVAQRLWVFPAEKVQPGASTDKATAALK